MDKDTAIKVYCLEDDEAWHEFTSKIHSGEILEVDEKMYYYFLEVLPLVFRGRTMKVNGKKGVFYFNFGFAEGAGTVVGFWKTTNPVKFFCIDTGVMNPNC